MDHGTCFSPAARTLLEWSSCSFRSTKKPHRLHPKAETLRRASELGLFSFGTSPQAASMAPSSTTPLSVIVSFQLFSELNGSRVLDTQIFSIVGAEQGITHHGKKMHIMDSDELSKTLHQAICKKGVRLGNVLL